LEQAGTMEDYRLREKLLSDDLTVSDLAEMGGVLLDVEGNQVLSFNEVGMTLIKLIRDDGYSTQDLSGYLVQRFGIDSITAQNDVEQFISEVGRFLDVNSSA
jgi:hypothetical protein